VLTCAAVYTRALLIIITVASQVGVASKAFTKGIWLFHRADTAHGDAHTLFLDTEGLVCSSRSEANDARTFALALLLSSLLVYNSVGPLDGAALSKLSVIVGLTRHIHVRAHARDDEDSGTDFPQYFPTLLWVLRDFSGKLEKDGKRLSPKDCLEAALVPEEGLSEAVDTKNQVRILLRSFFPERDLATLVRTTRRHAVTCRAACRCVQYPLCRIVSSRLVASRGVAWPGVPTRYRTAVFGAVSGHFK
jgi:hypothetical protein